MERASGQASELCNVPNSFFHLSHHLYEYINITEVIIDTIYICTFIYHFSTQIRNRTAAEKDEDVAIIATAKSEINNYYYQHNSPANSIINILKPTHRTAAGRYHNKLKLQKEEVHQQYHSHQYCNRQYNYDNQQNLQKYPPILLT